ncbi:MAG: CxxxxCH/CxxCH domain-containing protein, partial [Nitrospirae bacterium]|nr:CxxxxCH/CxxCH domain-containing protein [Nitrospirota bacterium]
MQKKKMNRKITIFLTTMCIASVLLFSVSSEAEPGDGNILKRSQGELCEGCHRTNTNTPSPGEVGFDQANWDNAIKMHSSEIAGACSNTVYKTKTACSSNGGIWTPGKWEGSSGWGVAGGQYGQFVCTTCHTSHDTTNIYLIKQNIAAQSGTLPGSIVDFRYLTGIQGSAPYALGDDSDNHSSSTRVCEVCHTITSYHRYNASGQADKNHNNATDCTLCHSHRTGFVPSLSSCTACHGQPPIDPGTLVNTSTGSTTAGAHNLHVNGKSYTCDTCHYDNIPAGVHNDGGSPSISMGFHLFGGAAQGGSYDGQVGVLYDALITNPATTVIFPPTGAKTCSSIYCHSTGQSTTDPNSATPTYANPVWDSTVTCGDCHRVTEASGLTSGGHDEHLGITEVNGCGDCHTGAANDASNYNSANHVNALIDVANTYSAGGARGNNYGTCSTASCHANVYGAGTATTPTWGSTGNGCSACHTTAIGTTGPATGSHAFHNQTDCTLCHNAGTTSTTKPPTEHADGDIDTANVGYTDNKVKGSAPESCSTASCHANVYGAGSVTTPLWGSTGNGCSACHTTAIAATGPATGSHAEHNQTDCTLCHNEGTTSTTKPSTEHADGDIDTANVGYTDNKAKGSAATTCSTASCHANVYGPCTVTTPTWGTTGNGCSACHTTAIEATGPATGSHA